MGQLILLGGADINRRQIWGIITTARFHVFSPGTLSVSNLENYYDARKLRLSQKILHQRIYYLEGDYDASKLRLSQKTHQRINYLEGDYDARTLRLCR